MLFEMIQVSPESFPGWNFAMAFSTRHPCLIERRRTFPASREAGSCARPQGLRFPAAAPTRLDRRHGRTGIGETQRKGMPFALAYAIQAPITWLLLGPTCSTLCGGGILW